MIAVDQWLYEDKVDAVLMMQVHDELVFEMPSDKAQDYAEVIRSMMENAVELDIPLEVDVGIADNWQEAH